MEIESAHFGSSGNKPLAHFIPPGGWLNDPNGLVFFEDEWHLFYQYLPPGGTPGKHWGHAVSPDLLHWEHLPVALYPDSQGEIFSGSCVVDERDASGFFGGNPGLVAIFTYSRSLPSGTIQTQGLAYSSDRGRTWTKYAGNPMLRSDSPDFRDPKVFWHSSTDAWVMVLAAGTHVEIYRSSDMKSWTLASTFGEGHTALCWECPDLFPLEDENGREVWLLTASFLDHKNFNNEVAACFMRYYSGTFDGFVFTPTTPEPRSLSEGPDDYAAITFSNAPDGSSLLMGWLNHWGYASYSGQMTLPRQLQWRDGALRQTLAPSVKKAKNWPAIRVETSASHISPVHFAHSPWEIVATESVCSWRMEACKGGQTIFTLQRDSGRGLWSFQRSPASYPVSLRQEKPYAEEVFTAPHLAVIEVGANEPSHIIVDACSVEIFCDGGRRFFAAQIFPPPGEWQIRFSS